MTKRSATGLGREIGLTGAEMNALLEERGYLEGEPGDYRVTEAGRPYVDQQHRDVGGSTHAGYISTRWDEGILEQIGDLPFEEKRRISQKVADHRDMVKQQNRAVRERLSATSATEDEGEDYASALDDKTYGVIGAIVIGGLAVAKLAQVAAPHVSKWWEEKGKPKALELRSRVSRAIRKKPTEETEARTSERDGDEPQGSSDGLTPRSGTH